MSFISIVPGLSLPSASLIDVMYPVGSIYESDDPAPPNIVFGLGTWERLRGVMLIGVDETDADFNVAGKFGGEKMHLLTVAEMPAHGHNVGVSGGSHTHGTGTLKTSSGGAHTHGYTTVANVNAVESSTGQLVGAATMIDGNTSAAGEHAHSISGSISAASANISVSVSTAGGGKAHNNLPPYRTTYMWRRTG